MTKAIGKVIVSFAEGFGTVGFGVLVLAILAMIAGCIMNMVKIVMLFTSSDPFTLTFLLVGRVVGLFIPFIGGVLGYF